MVPYMTFSHRSFLQDLRERPRQLRARVQEFSNTKGVDSSLVQAYNRALRALKDFRDAHMIVVTLLVVGPARRATKKATEAEHIASGPRGLKGTGGTDLVKFLKGVRDQTSRAYLQE
ncbi:Indoleamine 2,3-dioxygenase 1 [Leucoagaricus sp. SymC.cos]|nr:Indoleamine 2,3-dioxygenase 1 [Leucoagaricus sp. SymC.cos]